MSLTIHRLRDEEKQAGWITATERIFVTADRGRAVAEGDPDAAFLFCVPGQRIRVEDAARLGVIKKRGRPPKKKESQPEATKELKPEETKSDEPA